MAILIKKDDTGIKFYFDEVKPSAVIYTGSDLAIINDDILANRNDAIQLSQLVALVGVFIHSLQAQNISKQVFMKKIFDVVYTNELMPEQKNAKYSSKQILRRIYSNEIVTVDMKKRIRFEFTSFGFQDGKVIINYKPVIW